jgi:hypothetical protein
MLCFWTLPIVLILFKKSFGDWILSPPSGEPTQLGPIEGASPYLQTPVRLAAYRQSFYLGNKPLENHDTVILFSN